MRQAAAPLDIELQAPRSATPASGPEESNQPTTVRANQEYDKLPFSESTTETGSLSFLKSKRAYSLIESPKLKNSLLAGVGYLELANAGDFAANVWNDYPVPIYALVFMAIGGTLALGMVYFAVQDARLSWDNICGLRSERRYLRKVRSAIRRGDEMARALDCLLDMNFRETGTEVIDRIGMDICMGFGAFVVSVGTYMAIGGANQTVFQVSNLLSGYIGNGACALYGLANLLWSGYVWRREARHQRAGNKCLKPGPVKDIFGVRASSLQLHSALNGVNGAIAGAASLVTATMWEGYLALAPCILVSVLINIFWRRRVGYTRPFIQRMLPFNEDTLIAELLYIDSCRQQQAARNCSNPLSDLVPNPGSTSCVMEYITRHQLLEDLCHKILADEELAKNLTETSNDNITTIALERLAAIDEDSLNERFLQVAQLVVVEAAPKCFDYRERHLAEVLGCYLTSHGC